MWAGNPSMKVVAGKEEARGGTIGTEGHVQKWFWYDGKRVGGSGGEGNTYCRIRGPVPAYRVKQTADSRKQRVDSRQQTAYRR
jgi:hypothetical protein